MAAILVILFLAAGAGPPSPAYAALVRRYASGETEAAVAALRQWPEGRVRDEVRAVVVAGASCSSSSRWGTGPECEPATVWPGLSMPAALMLHTDAARTDASVEVHDRAALTIAELMVGIPPLADFAERWFGLRARLARARNRWPEAAAWAERGVAAFPRSARLRLLLGTIEETLATSEAARRLDAAPFDSDPLRARREVLAAPSQWAERVASRRPDTLAIGRDLLVLRPREPKDAREEPGAHLLRAQEALRSALALDPALSEARLRLARLAWWRGDLVEARSELGRILATRPDARVGFLAQLFLGRVQEDEGQLREAVASYEGALAREPLCQSAPLALSQVRLRLGDPDGARTQLEIALRNGRSRVRPDPYWLYVAPAAGSARDELAALRREATR